MTVDWKRKLTSRKFWAAAAGFASMLLIYFGKDAGTAEQTAALIMAGGSLIAYIIGEGIADGGNQSGERRYESGDQRAESGDRRKDGGEDDVSDAG